MAHSHVSLYTKGATTAWGMLDALADPRKGSHASQESYSSLSSPAGGALSSVDGRGII